MFQKTTLSQVSGRTPFLPLSTQAPLYLRVPTLHTVPSHPPTPWASNQFTLQGNITHLNRLVARIKGISHSLLTPSPVPTQHRNLVSTLSSQPHLGVSLGTIRNFLLHLGTFRQLIEHVF